VIPVGDFVRRNTTPYVNWTLIAINVAVFLYTLTLSTVPDRFIADLALSEADRFYYDWGYLPACVAEHFGVESNARPADLTAFCPADDREPFTFFTAMFMHGGWAHIVFNMLFLWIFGDNVEDRLGHARYLLFYLACGIAASVAQTAFALDTLVPNVGASGAIAGVMGAYLLLYPKAIVQVVILPLFFIPFFVPAIVLIGIWFVTQLFSGIAEVGQTTAGSGIAWWAHVGGFVAGALLILLIRPKQRRPSPSWD
jgi:membrane associated rhomboid family serine protease